MAKMYANVAHNILAAENDVQMGYVRRFSLSSLRYWPMQGSAILGFLGSFIPANLRGQLVQIWRKRRYHADGEQD